jgi:hypothetical protein
VARGYISEDFDYTAAKTSKTWYEGNLIARYIEFTLQLAIPMCLSNSYSINFSQTQQFIAQNILMATCFDCIK